MCKMIQHFAEQNTETANPCAVPASARAHLASRGPWSSVPPLARQAAPAPGEGGEGRAGSRGRCGSRRQEGEPAGSSRGLQPPATTPSPEAPLRPRAPSLPPPLPGPSPASSAPRPGFGYHWPWGLGQSPPPPRPASSGATGVGGGGVWQQLPPPRAPPRLRHRHPKPQASAAYLCGWRCRPSF